MSARWYQEAVIYCVEVASFQDSDGDGRGDLRGLISRLDYLARLGVTCLWLNPIHPSPLRDNGYDVTDYYGIDPRLGSLGDFAELTRRARERGIRIVLDLVVNHTSDEHPWFASARSDPESPFRDWYVWSGEEPPNKQQGTVFPGEQTETWTYDEAPAPGTSTASTTSSPTSTGATRTSAPRSPRSWASGCNWASSGFRIDAAPFVIEEVAPGVDPDRRISRSWTTGVPRRSGRPATRSCCARRTCRRATSRRSPAAGRTRRATGRR